MDFRAGLAVAVALLILAAGGLWFTYKPAAAPQTDIARDALEAAAGHTMLSRPCGQRPADLATERSGKVGDITWFVQLGRKSAKPDSDGRHDRIFLCTAKLIGAKKPALVAKYLDAGDGNGMVLIEENFSSSVASPAALGGGQADTIAVQTDGEGSATHHGADETFDCDDTKGCELTMTSNFLPPEKLTGRKLHVTFSNSLGEIGSVTAGLNGGFAAALESARKAWSSLRPQPKKAAPPAPAVAAPVSSAPSQPAPPNLAPPAQTTATAPSQPAAPAVAAKASFPCGPSSPRGRQLVCSDPDLARRDVALAALYRQALATAADERAVRADQDIFVSRRDACGTRACLEAAYAERRRDLMAFVGQ